MRPALIEVARRNSTVEIITQTVHPVDRDRKRELLSHLIKTQNWHQVLVFTRTKHGANKLAEQLNHDGITRARDPRQQEPGRAHAGAVGIQGRRACRCSSPPTSRRAASTSTSCRTSSTTTCPTCRDDYVHRIGRTGRAGATGEAISLVCVDEHEFLRDIEQLIKRTLPRTVIAGFEPDPHARAEPILQRGRAPRATAWPAARAAAWATA